MSETFAIRLSAREHRWHQCICSEMNAEAMSQLRGYKIEFDIRAVCLFSLLCLLVFGFFTRQGQGSVALQKFRFKQHSHQRMEQPYIVELNFWTMLF